MWVDNVKVLAVSAVVVLHVSSSFIGNASGTDINFANSTWWAGNFFDSITRWCVPVFLLISGYFLLSKQEDNIVFFRKRISKILIPLVFWSVFYMIWHAIAGYFRGNYDTTIFDILQKLVGGRPYYHLWYLYMLPFLYVITPYLRVLINNSSKQSMMLLVIFCLGLAALNSFVSSTTNYVANTRGIFTNLFIPYIGYYLLGGVLSKFELNIKTPTLLLLLCIAWLVTIFGNYLYPNEYFSSNFSLNTIAASFCIFLLMKSLLDFDIKLGFLSTYSFGIYLIHPIFRDVFSFLFKSRMLEFIHAWIYIPLVSLVIILLSYCVALLMSKIIYLRKCI